MMKKSCIALVLLTVTYFSNAQEDPVASDLLRMNRPTTSQRAEVSQKIGVSFVKVNYGRPNVKGRKIFGGLLQYGKIWRLGADYQTVIDFQNEYVINEDTIAKGKYALYAIPNENTWTIFLNKDVNGWGQYTYDTDQNVYEFNVPLEKSPEFTETFTLGFMNTSLNSGELYFQWENVRAKLLITIGDKHKKAIDDIFSHALVLDEWSLGYRYYLVSEYVFAEEKDNEKALKYIQKAIDSGVKVFYTYYLKGEILYAMGDKKNAVLAAKESQKTLFKNFENPEWEDKIQKAIINWAK